MLSAKMLDEVAKRLADAIPQGVKDLEAQTQAKFREILQATFAKFDLVTREEFDAQTKVLARTRSKVEALEKIVSELENKDKK